MNRALASLASLAFLPLFAATGCLPAAHRTNTIAAISDLHLGDPRSILADEPGRDVFFAELEHVVEKGGVRTLVLNGDVLELSLASEESAYAAARPFFERLAKVRKLKKVILVVGNHDHRLYEELPGGAPEKLGALFAASRLHEQLGDCARGLDLEVVYPDWTVPVKGGTVHFTHGHYFDPLTTPSFSGATSWEILEERNADWYALITAGGRDRLTRSVYRSIYHFGQHLNGALSDLFQVGGDEDEMPDDMGRREEARVAEYVGTILRDPATIAVVSGHTHHAGGRVQKIETGDHEVTLYDTGAFVVGHHGRPVRAHIFLLDPKSADMRLLRIDFPPEITQSAYDRAFDSLP